MRPRLTAGLSPVLAQPQGQPWGLERRAELGTGGRHRVVNERRNGGRGCPVMRVRQPRAAGMQSACMLDHPQANRLACLIQADPEPASTAALHRAPASQPAPLKRLAIVGLPRTGAWRAVQRWNSFCWWAGTSVCPGPWLSQVSAPGCLLALALCLPNLNRWSGMGQRRLSNSDASSCSRRTIRASRSW